MRVFKPKKNKAPEAFINAADQLIQKHRLRVAENHHLNHIRLAKQQVDTILKQQDNEVEATALNNLQSLPANDILDICQKIQSISLVDETEKDTSQKQQKIIAPSKRFSKLSQFDDLQKKISLKLDKLLQRREQPQKRLSSIIHNKIQEAKTIFTKKEEERAKDIEKASTEIQKAKQKKVEASQFTIPLEVIQSYQSIFREVIQVAKQIQKDFSPSKQAQMVMEQWGQPQQEKSSTKEPLKKEPVKEESQKEGYIVVKESPKDKHPQREKSPQKQECIQKEEDLQTEKLAFPKLPKGSGFLFKRTKAELESTVAKWNTRCNICLCFSQFMILAEAYLKDNTPKEELPLCQFIQFLRYPQELIGELIQRVKFQLFGRKRQNSYVDKSPHSLKLDMFFAEFRAPVITNKLALRRYGQVFEKFKDKIGDVIILGAFLLESDYY